MSEDDRSWHSQHRQPPKQGSEDDVNPIVAILTPILGILIMAAIVVLTVTTMMK
jgi:uncharacterized membrane protein (DUF106 family)